MKQKQSKSRKLKKCYFCGKPATRKGRIVEDPQDEIGMVVPICEECYEKFYEE